MMWLVAIVAFILILGLLIFVHELGHFIVAKKAGVQVQELGLGFPPRLIAIKRGETTYSLNLIPLGGFTKMLGEEDPTHPRSFAAKGIGIRFLILSAGPIMNLLLPIILFSIAFMIPSQITVEDVVVDSVAPGSPAETAGIVPGDTILSVNGHSVQNRGDASYYINLNLGKTTPFLLRGQDGSQRTVMLTPRWNPPEGQGAIGIVFPSEPVNAHTVSESYPPWEAIPLGAQTTWESFILIKNEVVTWFARHTAPQVVGPVGIFQLTGEVARAGVDSLMRFAAFISINLAIINLLPIPALDGGRILFLGIEGIRRGKRISPERERQINLVGFALLLTFILVITYFDIARLIEGRSIF